MHRSHAGIAIIASVALAPVATSDDAIRPIPFTSVSIGGSFWGPRTDAIRAGTLNANRHQCDITGRIANFERAGARIAGDPNPGAYQGLLFNDSDVYKMIEGWCDLIATEPDAARRAALESDLDVLIATIAGAQYPDGYINTYYTLKAGIENRFTREEWDHETYCMGHLIEAGVAHFRATGTRTLLDVAIRSADYLDSLYDPDAFTAPPGHQELEMALVKLADATSNPKYLDLAEFLIEQRGTPHRKLDGSMYGPWGDYAQDHIPAREQTEAAGHAVRAGYMYSAMADLALHGRGDYQPALHALWEDVTQRRIFVTGGIGPSASNEGFTQPYDIPTHSAYQETCASIALCMWAHRMFLLTGEASYMEQFERTLYNAVLAGASLDGSKFFYVNPLASRGGHTRRDWYECACCPPNVLRFFASLGQYVYAAKGDTIYVNLLMESQLDIGSGSLRGVHVEQRTNYPFGGDLRILAKNPTTRPVTLAVRAVGSEWGNEAVGPDGYHRVVVEPGSDLELVWSVSMRPRRIYADPRVKESVGRVAIMRGPLVYAAESIDNTADVNALLLPPGAVFKEESIDGAPAIVATGLRAVGDPSDDSLYRIGIDFEPAAAVMRPYFMWANRGPSSLVVWLPESAQFMDPQPPKGVTISASYVGHGDGPLAMIDRIEPASSIDHSIPRFTFWPHKGIAGGVANHTSGSGPVAGASAEPAGREWIMLEFDEPRRLSEVSVYWFDDTGRGQCRVPRAWSIEWRDGETWRAVQASGTAGASAFGVERDTFNTARFQSISTSGLRVTIDLQESLSTGVLELRVK